MPNEFLIRNGFFSQGNSNITGSLAVGPSGTTELIVSSTGITVGNISSDTHRITGSLMTSGSIFTNGSSSFIGTMTVSSSTATANAPIRNLVLINNTTGTATSSLGVGIEFESETTTTENRTVGYLDYVWKNNINGGDWGQAEISTQRSGSSVKSHMFAAGIIGSFNGGLTAAHTQLGDFTGAFPEYRVYASGSTTNATQTSLRFAIDDPNPLGLLVPNDTTWMFTVYIVARRTDADNESAAYWIQGCIDNNAGAIALVGAPTVTAIEDTVAWDATVAAVGGRLLLRVTGEASKTIYWNAITHIVQVSG